jgi:hypothetical protein
LNPSCYGPGCIVQFLSYHIGPQAGHIHILVYAQAQSVKTELYANETEAFFAQLVRKDDPKIKPDADTNIAVNQGV